MNATNLERMAEWWTSSPEGRKAKSTEQREHIKGREAKHTEIEGLRAEIKAGTPALEKERVEAEAEAKEADIAQRKAQLRLYQARAAQTALSAPIDGKIAALEGQLREGADPAIAEFVSEVGGTWDRERGAWATAHAGDPTSASARIAELSDLGEQAEALLFEPDPAVATAELDRLKSALGTPQGARA